MRLSLSRKDQRVTLTSSDPKEHERLKKFPGLLKDGPYFFIPANTRVAFNVVGRLKRKYKKLQVDPEVEAFINLPFKLREIPAGFKFFTEPKDFQRIALRYVYTVGGGGLLLEPGMGKTKVVLDFIALMGFTKTLIVCPKPLLFVWEDEGKKHRPDKSIYCVETTEWEQELPKIRAAEVVVINYNKAVMLADRLVDIGFQFIAVDEALIKDPDSGRTKALTWLGRTIKCRMLMSGTLVNNTPLDVFSPVRFLEPSLVGNSYYNFEQEYTFKAGARDPVTKEPTGPQFIVGFKDVPEVKSILESVSIVMTKEEWLDLPAKKFIDIYVQPSEYQRQVYQDLQSNYICEIYGKEIQVENPLSVLTKLIQIANGFIYTNPESDISELDDSEFKQRKRETIYFAEQPKLDRLIELLKTDLASRRSMVWYNMTAEGNAIEERLKREGIRYLLIKGGEKKVGQKVRTFNNDSSYSVLLCQAKSVNYGITVLGTKDEEADREIFSGLDGRVFTQVFYSLNFSLEVYLQQQDRIHRLGQERECEYYRLFTNLPAEIHIKDKISEKLSIRGQILQDIIFSLGISM